MVFVCEFLCAFAKFVQKFTNLSQNPVKSYTKLGQSQRKAQWMLSCPIHINLGCFEKVLWKLCKIFEKLHEKSQKLNHVLVPIEGKDWGQKFLLGIFSGVLEGLINRSFFWFSIWPPPRYTLSHSQIGLVNLKFICFLLEYRNGIIKTFFGPIFWVE